MEENVFRSLEQNVEKIEKEYGSLENYAISTILGERHRMRMEDDYASFRPQMREVYQDLFDLELADLMDYQEFCGRFDGDFI